MAAADQAYVYFTDHTLEMKKLPAISVDEILQHFDHPNLEVIKDKQILQEKLNQAQWTDHKLILMSSGNFGGMDLKQLARDLF